MFSVPESARDIRDSVLRFVQHSVEPLAAQIEETGRIPSELLKTGADLGLFGLGLPERYGGVGESLLNSAVAIEALSTGPGGVTMVLAPSAVGAAIHLSGTEQQKERYLPPLASGEKLGAFALTEPEAGSDASGIKTRAVKDGDHWVIDGSKCFISRSMLAEVFLVSAVTDPEKGKNGISVFIVDKVPEVRIGREDRQLGLRGSGSAEVHFDGVRVHERQVLGEVNQGFGALKRTLTRARLWAAARSLGVATACLELATRHTHTRVQFGKRLEEFQAVKLKLADMAVDLTAARLLVYSTAQAMDQGSDCEQETSIAKLFTTEAAGRAADMTVQLHGAMGVSRDYPVERFYRDVRAYRILDGTSDVQRLVIASGLRRNGIGGHVVPGSKAG